MTPNDAIDPQRQDERLARFRDQIRRWRSGELSDGQFRSLRLDYGIAIRRQTPMLCIAMPEGRLNSTQLRALARLARQYGHGFCRVTARQEMQLSCLTIEDAPDILAELAALGMPGFQTSGKGARHIAQVGEARIAAHAAVPADQAAVVEDASFARHREQNAAFARWLTRCAHSQRVAGYRAVSLPLKRRGALPGKLSADQMDIVADLATHFSFGELRIGLEQNIILADVREAHLYALWLTARGAGLATPSRGA